MTVRREMVVIEATYDDALPDERYECLVAYSELLTPAQAAAILRMALRNVDREQSRNVAQAMDGPDSA